MGIILPWPPSANHLWRSYLAYDHYDEPRPAVKKSSEYEYWIAEAGYKPIAGKWIRFTELPRNKLPWGMLCVAVGLHYWRDASNLY